MNKRDVLVAIRPGGFAFVLLILAALACNRTVPTPVASPAVGDVTPGTPAIEATAISFGTQSATAPAADTPALTATETATLAPPTPGVSAEAEGSATPYGTTAVSTPATPTPTGGTPECTYHVEFVTDVTIPDDTELAPGVDFIKTWRMRNAGTCPWVTGTSWVFISGDRMSGPDSVSVPLIEPGATADIAVNLTAPDSPGDYTGYWQMRHPDPWPQPGPGPAGERFGDRAYVRIKVPGAEITPTSTASAEPPVGTATPSVSVTPAPGAGPVIEHFRSNVREADPGDTVQLEWETDKATDAILYHLMPTGQLGSFWEVAVDGVFEYEIDSLERNHTDFMLFVNDEQGRTAQATLSILLRCPDTWFFAPAPDECPAGPAVTSDGAEQHFQHGTMIWVASQDLIFVLFDDGTSPRWQTYRDEWDPGEPESDPSLTPPSGLYQPVRGFGLVWREQPGLRDRLGWATDVETAFVTAVQHTSRPRYNDTYIRAQDGSVWKLLPEFSGWEKLR